MPLPRTRRGIRRVSALIPFPRKGKMRFHNMQKKILMVEFYGKPFFFAFYLEQERAG